MERCRRLLTLTAGLGAIVSAARAQSGPAYQWINEQASANRRGFYIYTDHDAGANKVYPSGIFPRPGKLQVDPACIDDPNHATTGCSMDTGRLDCAQGTVFRLTWSPMTREEFFGLNFEEPENYSSRPRGTGYDLSPAAELVFRFRSPTGIWVSFGMNDGRSFSSGFMYLPASRVWEEKRIRISDLRASDPSVRLNLRNVHIPFFAVTNGERAPGGGTLLLDDIRLEPVPARQAAIPAFPPANRTCGVIPVTGRASGRVPVPPDQINRNVATSYESAVALWALLRRGAREDLENARALADTFVYAAAHDNRGALLPKPADGTGLRNAYIAGDLPFLNDQQCPGSETCSPDQQAAGAKSGDVRLAGFGGAKELCGQSRFCLVQDGATGGNNAFSMIALLAAYRRFGDVKYVETARRIANWIHGLLLDPDANGFGGYFTGYPDEGRPKELIRSKSVENNADIAAAFQMLADVESELCRRTQAETWAARSRIAGDFVLRMFDPLSGRFFAGTAPAGTAPLAGVQPDGEQRSGEVINTADFLDANTFVPLALMSLPAYREAIDWRRPLDWASRQVQKVQAGEQVFEGFNIVPSPVSGPAGIAWEFTGQMVVAMRAVDARYGENRFRAQADRYLEQIRRAQSLAPFAEGRGLAAATMEGGSRIAPYEQCLSTPFQCIAQRTGLAATAWAIFAENGWNPLGRGAVASGSQPVYVNAASFQGCLSPGGLFSVFQPDVSSQVAAAGQFPLPMSLAGAEVRLGDRAAPLLYAGPGQVNGQVPYEMSLGETSAELIAGSALLSHATVHLASVSPGLFLAGDGRRCVAFNFSGSLNSPRNPARPGDGVTVYLTGMGAVDNPVGSGLPAPPEPLSRAKAVSNATIGGKPAGVIYLGLTPGTAGVGQANLVPDSQLTPGEHEVRVELDGVPSNGCLVSIGPEAGYPAPSIDSIVPDAGSKAGGARVTIRGAGFWASGLTVRFGESPVREVVQAGRSEVTVIAPPGSGVVEVTVTAPDGRAAAAPRAFTYR